MSHRPSPFEVAALTALAIAVLWFVISLGHTPFGWLFPSANAQTVPPLITFPNPVTLQDRETYSMALDQTHQVCWADPNNPPAAKVKIWRYRVEGGGRTLYLDLPRSGWVANGTITNSFCKLGISIPKAGHWIYEAALCWTNAGVDTCSDVVTAACAAGAVGCAGNVGSSARGWWIYAFLPAPSGVGVN
jgi:hypothetical protein